MTALGMPRSPSGGAFRVDRPIPSDLTQSIGAGWSATIGSGAGQIAVHGPNSASTYEEALEDALGAAQQALDLLAIQGGVALSIEGAESEHVIWWTDASGVILRDVAVEDLKVSVSARATVRDAKGNAYPQTPTPVTNWHESFRYFRLSQTTGDLFDAYRNLYLAVESLLSTAVPVIVSPKGKPEGEGSWLRRALTDIHPSKVDLANYAPPGSVDPITGVYNDLYAGTRTRLFHSKNGRPILLPHTLTGRSAVLESLERLGRLYVDLARSVLSVQREMGAMTEAGFRQATEMDGELVVSDDTAPAQDSDTLVNPTGGATFALPTSRPAELARPGLTTWLGQAPVAEVLKEVSGIGRVGLTVAGGLMLVGRQDPPLSLEGVEVLQVQRSVRLVNQQTVKFLYAT